ncbi:hypothetical protein AB0D49_26220 [Streptomyces sp. NPDC048290]|uniref:hypothetical protein n=1 Tax=Streptomyces sp. NPDC048290 TaxID=3155811 RepID=UPI0034490388
MPEARFFFDPRSGVVLWAATPEDKAVWGYAIELDRLPISDDLREVLLRLMHRFDTSLNWRNPNAPGPWREEECQDFNEAVYQVLGRLRAELGPDWLIYNEFLPLQEDPDLLRYLADPKGFFRH